MKTIKLSIELEYDDAVMHGDDNESKAWFYHDILFGEKLIVHSNEIGDTVGHITKCSINDDPELEALKGAVRSAVQQCNDKDEDYAALERMYIQKRDEVERLREALGQADGGKETRLLGIGRTLIKENNYDR